MRRLLLAFVLLGWNEIVTASPDAEPFVTDRTAIEQQQKTLLEQAEQQRDALRNPLSPITQQASQPSQNDDVCLTVNHITFVGGTVMSSDEQQALISPWTHQCLTLSAIQQLVHRVSQHYLEQGYITSQAWLPEQDISFGQLQIAITEGRIESITQAGKTPPTFALVFPHYVGQILNLRDLEQGLEQLNRLSSQPVTIDIQPGSQPGYSQVLIVPLKSHHPIGFSLAFDNSGQESTGTQQISSALTFDNPLGLADQWHISASRDAMFQHDRRSRSLSGSVTLPYGYWLFSYQAAWNDFYQELPFPGHHWRYEGMAHAQRLGINRTLLRDGNQKFGIDIALTRRRNDNRIADQLLTNSSARVSSLTLGLQYSRRIGAGYATFNPVFSQGLRGMGAERDDSRTPDAPRHQFRKYSLNTSYLYSLTPTLYYLTSAYGQTSSDNLYASERIAIGGQYSVRGFKEQYLSGLRGVYWRNELNWQPAFKLFPVEFTFTAALDSGWIQTREPLVEGGYVTGAALSVTLNGRRMQHATTFGKPLSYPHTLHPDPWVIYWQTTVTL